MNNDIDIVRAQTEAVALFKKGEISQAEDLCRRALTMTIPALRLMSLIRAKRGYTSEALETLGFALRLAPTSPSLLTTHGDILALTGNLSGAIRAYDKALAITPGYTDAHFNRANLLHGIGRFDDAVSSYDKALAINSSDWEAWVNRGNALRSLGRLADALTSYRKALSVNPEFPQTWNNLGNVLRDQKRLSEALDGYEKALALYADYAEAHYNRGNVLQDLGRFTEAVISYDNALRLQPRNADAFNGRGTALYRLRRAQEALSSFDQALVLRSDFADAYYNRGNALKDLKQLDAALESYKRALQHAPTHRFALSGVASAALHMCDWASTNALKPELEKAIVNRSCVIEPFVFLGYSGDESLQRECAKNVFAILHSAKPGALWTGSKYLHKKIRLAYLSADFHHHATAFLTAELFERHDRSRFEVSAISYGPDDGSEIRTRLVRAFDAFHDVGSHSSAEIATSLRDAEIDIAVDLKGHTRDARPEILIHRPCPIQVNYLGYPGTIGADFIDYVIADPIVAPFSDQSHYLEKIVHLPDCYQANDTKRGISRTTPTRQSVGLPEKAFVFCCFNNNWKITEPVFDVWMRLLLNVPNAVIWLIASNSFSCEALRRQAEKRGIHSSRLIFADGVPLDQHLARQRLADVCLDTLPYNAHTTASDALWAEVPFITCKGDSFASRVGASLLNSIGLNELVTNDLADYEQLALTLARDSRLLGELRKKLIRNIRTAPLFDTGRFCTSIETAYLKMYEIFQEGESPRSFSV